MPKTQTGYDRVLLVVCRLSKFAFAIPCKSTLTALEALQLVMSRVMGDHGVPDDIVSDRDTLFTSKEWETYYNLMGVKLSMTTAHRAQGDGQSERTIRTITQVCRTVGHDREDQWDVYLPIVMLGYNNRVHSATAETPHFVAFTFDPKIPEILTQLRVEADVSDVEQVWGAAQDALVAANARMVHFANEARRERSLKVGDYVWLSTADLTLRNAENVRPHSKFAPKWVGKYLVLQDMGNGSYKLRIPPSLSRLTTNVFNIDKLKKAAIDEDDEFAGRGIREPEPLVVADGSAEWGVDAILDARRGEDGGIQVLVQWTGYDPPDPNKEGDWEPAENCKNAKDLLLECDAYVQLQQEDLDNRRIQQRREAEGREKQRQEGEERRQRQWQKKVDKQAAKGYYWNQESRKWCKKSASPSGSSRTSKRQRTANPRYSN